MYVPCSTYVVFNSLLWCCSASNHYPASRHFHPQVAGHRHWEVLLAYNRVSLVSAQLEEGLDASES